MAPVPDPGILPDATKMNEVARLILQAKDAVAKDPQKVVEIYRDVTQLTVTPTDVFSNLASAARHTAAGYVKHIAPALETLKASVPECSHLTLPPAAGGAGAAGASAAAREAVASGVRTAVKVGSRVIGIKAALVVGALALAGVAVYYGSQYLGERAADEPVKLGPAAEGRTVERRPGMGRDPTPSVGDANDAWAVWYVDNMAYKPVMVGTMRDYLATRLCNTYPGGGNPDGPSVPMQKVLLVGGAASRQAAVEAARSQFANIRVAGRMASYSEWFGDHAGQVHDVDEIR